LADRLHGDARDDVGIDPENTDTILICAPVVSQYAAMGALHSGAKFTGQRSKNAAIRHYVVAELRKKASAFCAIPASEGAFYLLLKGEDEAERDGGDRTADSASMEWR